MEYANCEVWGVQKCISACYAHFWIFTKYHWYYFITYFCLDLSPRISVVWLWDVYKHIFQQGRDRMGSNVFPFLNKMGLSWPGYPQDSSCLYRARLSSWQPRVCACAHSTSPPQCGCTTWLASGDLLTGAAPDRRQTSSLGSHDLSPTKPSLNY